MSGLGNSNNDEIFTEDQLNDIVLIDSYAVVAGFLEDPDSLDKLPVVKMVVRDIDGNVSPAITMTREQFVAIISMALMCWFSINEHVLGDVDIAFTQRMIDRARVDPSFREQLQQAGAIARGEVPEMGVDQGD